MKDSADTVADLILSIQSTSGLEVWVEPWTYPILYLSAEIATISMMEDSLISSLFLQWKNKSISSEKPEE